MAGQGSFLRARARAGAAALIGLALITAIAAALVTGIVGTVGAFESATVMTAVSDASGDRDRVTVRFEAGAGDSAARIAAIDQVVAEMGAPGALVADDEGDGLFALRPNPAHLSGDAAVVLAEELRNMQRLLRESSGEAVQVSGGLRATLASVIEPLQTRRGPTTVALAMVALLALVVVGAASLEPVRTRYEERALLRARGMSKAKLARIGLIEVAPVLVLSGAVGGALGGLGVWLWSGMVMPWMTPVVVTAALAAVGLIVVWGATLRGVDRRSARGDLVAGISAVVLLAVLAGLAAWQFWQAGTPVVVQGNGRRAIDPVIAMAPALVLALFALLVIVLAGPLAALASVVFTRTRSLSPVLPLRLASRRIGRHALTSGSVAFAVAIISLTVAYAGSLLALGDTPEEIRVGADVRVTSIPEDADVSALAALSGVDAAMPARTLMVRAGEGTFPLLGVAPTALGAVMLDADGLLEPAALGEVIALPPLGVPLPAEATTLRIDMTVAAGGTYEDQNGTQIQAPAAGATVEVTLEGADGNVATVSATNLEVTILESSEVGQLAETNTFAQRTVDVPLPAGGPWRVIAVDASLVGGYAMVNTPVQVTLAASGQRVDLSGFRGLGDNVTATDTGLELMALLPAWNDLVSERTRAITGDVPRRMPIALTEGLAESLGAHVGTALSLRMASFTFTIDTEVVAVIPVLPGVTDASGVLIDFNALRLSTAEPLHQNEMWLSADDPGAVAAAADDAIGGARVDVTDARAAEKAFDTARAFLLAAAGAVLLAVVVLVLRRSRADGAERELGVLAVLGAGRRGAARLRATEDSFAIVLGALGGVAAGLAMAWLIVPSLARVAYVGMASSYPVALVIPLTVLVISVGVATAVFVVLAATVRAPRTLARVLREAE